MSDADRFKSPLFRLPIETKNTPLSAKEQTYSDFFNDMVINPITDDLAKKTNEDAVKQSIVNLILTKRGERPFQPFIGSDIYQLLFENITLETTSLLETIITETITNYEPRCNLISVTVSSVIDSNDLNARIVFKVINNDNVTELNTPLTRIR